jgi:NAD(P)-dependent dehydrogenase (short-subunit alcohol dehydrogenase family)
LNVIVFSEANKWSTSVSKFNGVSAAITGGADGIGLGLGRALGKRGARIALLDIRAEAAREAAALLAADGIQAIGIGCDVTDDTSLAYAAAQVASQHGGVGLLWANAGVGSIGSLTSIQTSFIDWVYAVNVKGTIDTVRAFWPLLLAANGVRHVGFTGSSNTLGHIPPGPLSVYAASKWATIGIAEAVSAEAKSLGMGASIFCPGLLDTRIWDGGRARPDRFGGPIHQPEAAGERWRSTGMSVEWACEAAIDAAEKDQFYCCPVDQHSLVDFDTRMANVRKGFVVNKLSR